MAEEERSITLGAENAPQREDTEAAKRVATANAAPLFPPQPVVRTAAASKGTGGRVRQPPRFRPILLEVAGSSGDAVFDSLSGILRQYRNRYSPLLRIFFTAVLPSVSEDVLFGDVAVQTISTSTSDNSSGAPRAPYFSAPECALSVERSYHLIPRLHELTPEQTVARLRTFFNFHFLPLKIELALHERKQREIAASSASPCESRFDAAVAAVAVGGAGAGEESSGRLLMRHYIHETTRTASFLIADTITLQAVLVDPQFDISEYEADLARHGLTLVAVCLTHYYIDIRMGHTALLHNHPQAKLLCGDVFTGGASQDSLTCELRLSDSLLLVLRPVAVFAPEGVIIEVHYKNALAALLIGTVLSLDAFPRQDLDRLELMDSNKTSTTAMKGDAEGEVANSLVAASPAPTSSSSSISRRQYDILRRDVWDRYFTDPELDAVLFFPSHGGYNNVTNQLDLYWVAHVGDLKRMHHTRTILDKLQSYDAFNSYVRRVPPLPQPPLFVANRLANLGKVSPSLVSPVSIPRIIVDCREIPDYHACHLEGCVSVPMNFPAIAYGAKKAELWLQCLLLPGQPILAVCSSPEQVPCVKDRLQLIRGAGSIQVDGLDEIAVFTASELRSAQQCDTAPPYLRALKWIETPLQRLTSYSNLAWIEPRNDVIIVDSRTPYEFKNGSHTHSTHLPLADICRMTAESTAAAAASSTTTTTSLGWKYLDRIHGDTLVAGLPVVKDANAVKHIVLYCAGGYRSHIAASLFRRAFEVAGLHITVSDVAGGALQIMTQRPDLWQVKDRSIICIS